MKYIRIHDPGHSWLKVPISELKELGIADQISSYSYKLRDFAYLEEDCDMNLFLVKKGITTRELYEQVVEDKYVDTCDIRDYRSYTK